MTDISNPILADDHHRWYDADAGRAKLVAKIDDFVASAAHGSAGPDALAMRVTAGAGKSRSTLNAIARHADDLLARGHVLIYVPTLDLAERAYDDFRAIAPSVPCAVVRGREAARPDSPKRKMCERLDMVKKVTGLVPSITNALCRRVTQDGVIIEAKCAAHCPYLAQYDEIGAKVYFLAHNYLTIKPPIDTEIPCALRVVDEKFWHEQARTTTIFVENFMAAPSKDFDPTMRDDLARVKGAIVDGLQRDIPIKQHLSDQGIGEDLLSDLANAERTSRAPLDLYPNADISTINLKMADFDKPAFLSSIARQSLFARLVNTQKSHCNRITIRMLSDDHGPREAIQHHQLKELPMDAPVLMLDADADPKITQTLVPGANFDTIDIKPEAHVVQVHDRTLSNAWLVSKKDGKNRRQRVLDVVKREVTNAEGRGVLVVATTAALKSLHEDCGHETDGDGDLSKPLLGATTRWFGPRMHGVNDFEDYQTIIIIGRLQPPTIDIEAQARCLFGDDDQPFETLKGSCLLETQSSILMQDGSHVTAATRAHPDPRVQTMVEQTRELGILQAIARLRLVAPQTPKRVVVLGATPLPRFPVSTLTSFEAVTAGLEHEADPVGYSRMEAALLTHGRRPVRGLRLSAAGLFSDLPRDFDSLYAAEGFRRGRDTPALCRMVHRISVKHGWPITHLRLKSKNGGQTVPACVFMARSEAKKAAILLWPDLIPCITRHNIKKSHCISIS
jgi:hypothetical protein